MKMEARKQFIVSVENQYLQQKNFIRTSKILCA
jgi:hypothetical protein